MVKIIVAVDKKGAIGKNNDLLYTIKEDLKNFKELTSGNIVVMGRNTWDSLPIKPLPNRTNIVLTKKLKEIDGAIVLSNFEELEEYLKNTNKDVYIMGGASIYNQVIEKDMVTEAHVTFIDDIAQGADAFVDIDKLKSLLPKSNYIKSFDDENLESDYIVLSK